MQRSRCGVLLSYCRVKVWSKRACSTAPLVACKRRYLNYYGARQKVEKPLASHGWHNNKSKGDFFVVNPRPERLTEAPRPFDALGLSSRVLEALRSCRPDIATPTEIQSMAVPKILAGHNALIAAETGCGKTLAYLLPLLDNLLRWQNYAAEKNLNSPSAIIVVPNRELAQQIYHVAKPFMEELELNAKCIIGGHTKKDIRHASFDYVDLLIGSFGALSKYFTSNVYKLTNVHNLVLDEADTLLDESFIDQVVHTLSRVKISHRLPAPPVGCQLIMASATMPKVLPELFLEHVAESSLVKITTENLHKILSNVPQRFLRIGKLDRPLELLKLVRGDLRQKKPVMIFTNRTETCNYVSLFLNENGIKCVALNKRTPMEIKKENYEMFIRGKVNVIACTDIGSRGLDTIRTKHVINFEFPHYMADYIHRCGRTGRVGSPAGCLVTNFVTHDRDIELAQKIEATARNDEYLPQVDGNIKGIILRRMLKSRHTALSDESF